MALIGSVAVSLVDILRDQGRRCRCVLVPPVARQGRPVTRESKYKVVKEILPDVTLNKQDLETLPVDWIAR